jgi:hypothetical protein
MSRRSLALAVLLGLLLLGSGWAADPTTVRVFQVHNCSVTDAAAAVQSLLSENGSLTVHPYQSRITVQDSPDVVERVAKVIADMDRSPDRYLIEVVLLEGVSQELPPQQRAHVDSRLGRMFPFVSYRRIGAANFDGVMGETASADLGEGNRVSFLAESVSMRADTPYGIPDPGNRLHLQWLTLNKATTDAAGRERSTEILRTSVYLSEKQEVFIGAGSSEDSGRGLVLILQARSIGAD